jgi:hypothetical protein
MPNEFDPPRTQYDRNLTIRLEGGGPTDSFTFPIKPGEFQSDHPARMSTTQTLQGVYQDFGGMGVQKLVYQGHTGWRRRRPNAPHDGFETFEALYKESYLEYHKRIQAVDDPSMIKCFVIDDLYDTVYQVSLDDFQATKSRSTPLLYHYTMRMTVIFSEDKKRDPVDYLGLPVLTNNIDEALKLATEAMAAVTQHRIDSKRTYKVQAGDSIQSVALLYSLDPMKLAEFNKIEPPFAFDPGIYLIIPN